MEELKQASLLGIYVALFILLYCGWRVYAWIWWEPKKLEKYLNKQGIRGPPYKLLHGSMKDSLRSLNEARSKPCVLSHHIAPRLLPYVYQTVQTYGKLSIFWYGVTPRVHIMDPELVMEVLSSKSGHFSKAKVSPFVELLINGLVSYDGKKWAKHRRIINPAFHLEKLKMMLPAFDTCCSELIKRWAKLASEGSCELDVWPELQNLTGDVISRTAFGSSYEQGRRIFQLQIEQAELFEQISQSIYIPGSRFLPTRRNNRMKEIDREIRALLKDMIKKREMDVKLGRAQSDDLLGLLMDSNLKEMQKHGNSIDMGMSIDDVITECKLFYVAGQETTSTLLVWTMVLLSIHPEWQTRAREEVLQVFGRRKEPNFDALQHLKTVTMILYEVLRLYPPIVLLLRDTHKKMRLGKFTLPAGVQVGIPLLFIHHDRDLWGEDAEEFNPERFSGGVSQATNNQASFLPFSWGPRICIGQNFAMIEAKMALAMILQCFSFELSNTYVHDVCSLVTLQPKYGAQIILHKLGFLIVVLVILMIMDAILI